MNSRYNWQPDSMLTPHRPWIFELAVEASPTGVVVSDESGTILFANPQIETIFGYPVAELVGQSIDLLVPESSRHGHTADRGRFWTNPATRAMGVGREVYGRRKDGSVMPIEIGLSVAGRDDRRLVVASVTDISVRRDLERQLRASLEDKLSFERLISQLAARFVTTPPEEVDEAIIESQRLIVAALDLDVGMLWQTSGDAGTLVQTHGWPRPENPAVSSLLSDAESFPWLMSKMRAGEASWFSRVDEVPDPVERARIRRLGIQSSVTLPLREGDALVGAVAFGTTRSEREWSPEIVERLRLVAAVFAQVLGRRHGQAQLRHALDEVQRLRDELAEENVQLREEVKALQTPRTIASESPAARRVLADIERIAPSHATVLLLGETGVGKEVFAQAIHDMSKRHQRPMIRVNCAAIPTALIESELFGRERGAYTGALSRQLGRFELADKSTIFLDEVAELPLEVQVKLLRVLQDRVFERLGSGQPVKVDVRVIAATNRNLEQAVADRTFREDLFYRLNVCQITIPPLRERVEDIPVLAWTFIDDFSKDLDRKIESVSKESLAALQRYSWPGNVRELRNVIERAVIFADGPRLTVEPPAPTSASRNRSARLDEVEINHIREVLGSTGWRVRGPGGAAERLGMKPTTLESRMEKLHIQRPGTPEKRARRSSRA